MARTAVVAGTATAVSGGVARRQHARWQQEADAQAPPPPPPAEAAPAAPPVDLVAQLQGLAALRDQGVLTQEEFDAQKARILAS
jgi:hypothetical protein